ncbi:hypothetical protein OROMI_004811 [Orobanche minor]
MIIDECCIGLLGTVCVFLWLKEAWAVGTSMTLYGLLILNCDGDFGRQTIFVGMIKSHFGMIFSVNSGLYLLIMRLIPKIKMSYSGLMGSGIEGKLFAYCRRV